MLSQTLRAGDSPSSPRVATETTATGFSGHRMQRLRMPDRSDRGKPLPCPWTKDDRRHPRFGLLCPLHGWPLRQCRQQASDQRDFWGSQRAHHQSDCLRGPSRTRSRAAPRRWTPTRQASDPKRALRPWIQVHAAVRRPTLEGAPRRRVCTGTHYTSAGHDRAHTRRRRRPDGTSCRPR